MKKNKTGYGFCTVVLALVVAIFSVAVGFVWQRSANGGIHLEIHKHLPEPLRPYRPWLLREVNRLFGQNLLPSLRSESLKYWAELFTFGLNDYDDQSGLFEEGNYTFCF